MRNTNLNFGEQSSSQLFLQSAISFKWFMLFLQNQFSGESLVKEQSKQTILEKFTSFPSLPDTIHIEEVSQYQELLEHIYAATSPLVIDEAENLWALCAPLSHAAFYSTDTFYNLLSEKDTDRTKSAQLLKDHAELEQNHLWFIYSFLLHELYHFSPVVQNPNIFEHPNPTTGLSTFYQINLDNRFVKVEVIGELPDLNYELLKPNFHQEAALELLQKHLPLSLFRVSGFSVLTLSDVTINVSIENIRQSLLNHEVLGREEYYQRVILALKNLAGDQHLNFGLLPFFKINNKQVLDPECSTHSILLQAGREKKVAEETYLSLVNKFIQDPRPAFFSEIDQEKKSNHFFLAVLGQAGVKSFAVLPLYYNKQLTGVVEVYTLQEKLLIEPLLARLEPALPWLSQLLQNNIDDFNGRVERIIKEKFTSVQPAVQWKFNEVAWNYLKQSSSNNKKPELEPINFENVYPVYGAIDIKDSTLERNQALQADLQKQIALLDTALNNVKDIIPFNITDEFSYKVHKWSEKLKTGLSSEEEVKITHFLGKETVPFLKMVNQDFPDTVPFTKSYLEISWQNHGIITENRHQLEISFQKLNKTILDYLEHFQDELQSSYPCYYEAFRTDGIEYDFYIGQSLAPDKPFNLWYLKNLRLWQLNGMAAIAKQTKSLQGELPKTLQTTQLIFVHAHTITISFRTDERRFDVEGAHNVHYEIIKKRIDKVNLLNTNERLTQPDKIAIVYHNNREAEEYTEYIQYLQERNILNKDLEYLDLEDLQGITGLKALRVGVNYENY